jgi:hypothetical protein
MPTNYSGAYAAPRLDLGMAFMEHVAAMDTFIASKVLGMFSTPKRAASFSAITRESLLQDSDALREARGHYNRVNTGAKDKSFSCEEFGLEQVVDDVERSLYASDFDAEDAATKITAQALMIQYEKRVAAAVFNTTTWTGASLFTDVSGAPWDTAGSVVIAPTLAAKEKVRTLTGMIPNAMIIAESQVQNLLKNTEIKNQFPGAPLITLEMLRSALASIFGLSKLIVGGAVRNSAIEGQTFVGTDIWTDDFAMVAIVAEDNAPLTTPCIGRTFLWTQDSPSPVTVEQYREEQSRGDVIRARHHVDEVIIDASFGHLLKID